MISGTNGGTFVTLWSYNTADLPVTMTYPGGNSSQNGEQVTFTYTPQMTLNTLYGAGGYYYVERTAYDAAGRIENRDLGARAIPYIELVDVDPNYNAWNMDGGRLLSQVTTGNYNGTPVILQSQSYTYDDVGNILTMTDAANSSQKQCFTYDALDRLTSAYVGDNLCSGAVGFGEYADETYTYSDTTGNLASKTGMGTYTYDPNRKHAVISTSSGWAYQYDGNGNMTRRDPPGTDYYDFVYDAENRITQVKKNNNVLVDFTYDGDGNRVKAAITGGTTTAFVGEYFEWTGATSSMVKYYQAGGQRVAMRTGTGSGTTNLKFLLGDHLGSKGLTFNADLTGQTKQLYKPWGESRYSSGTLPTKYQYTGQYSYATAATGDFGLMYYKARWYDSQLSRFAQADTVTPGGVQGLDRYAGMANNPVRFNDPTGHCVDPDSCPPPPPSSSPTPDPYSDPKYSNWRHLREGSSCSACHVTHDGYKDDGRIPDNSQLDADLVEYYRTLDPLAKDVHSAILVAAGTLGSASLYSSGSDNRAVDLHNSLKSYPDPQPYEMRTTGVLTTKEGVTLVASSNAYLDPLQESMLLPNEIEVMGQQGIHAEEKLVNAALGNNLTPETMFTSRPVCEVCQALLEYFNIPFFGP